MRTDKIVWRALAYTWIAITVLFGIMLLALCFIFPSTMMHITYDLGMETSSINNARRAYKTSNEVYYIAFATEVAIGENDYEEVERCGDIFISDDQFVAYCQTRDKELQAGLPYERYVYAQVCMAKYRLGKKTQSVERAFVLTKNSFPENNAVVAVLLTALNEKDEATVDLIEGKLLELQNVVPQEDKSYLQEILGFVNKT